MKKNNIVQKGNGLLLPVDCREVIRDTEYS